MMEKLLNGLYSNITVNVNNKDYMLHLEILKDKSGYFDIISKKIFSETNVSKIIFYGLDGKFVKPKIFEILIKLIYYDCNFKCDDNVCNIESIIDLIELHRLCKYLGVIDQIQIYIKDVILDALCEINPCNNICKNLIETIKLMLVRKNQNGKYNSMLITSWKPPKKLIDNDLIFYKKKDELVYPYTQYLLDIFESYSNDDESAKKKYPKKETKCTNKYNKKSKKRYIKSDDEEEDEEEYVENKYEVSEKPTEISNKDWRSTKKN